jgi:hypothetical protein
MSHQDGARFDRGELPGVADEDEPRAGPDRLDEPGHQRERHHRGLIDDDEIVGKVVAAVVTKATVAVRTPAEEPVQGRGLEREQLVADRVADRDRRRLLVHSLLEPGGGLARRRGERHERLGRPHRRSLLGEQRDDPRNRGRLAGARAARYDREPAQDRGRGGQALVAVLLTDKEPLEAIGERVPHCFDRTDTAQGQNVRGDLALLAPVAVEIERAADQAERAVRATVLLSDRDERAGRQALGPCARSRPGQHGDVYRLVGIDRRRRLDRREVDVHVTEPRTADRERRREPYRLILFASQVCQPPRDVHIGRREHSGVIELAQQPHRAARTSDVERVRGGRFERGHDNSPRSSTSLSFSTSAFDGSQANTPHGVPATVGVPAPVIPRRNR